MLSSNERDAPLVSNATTKALYSATIPQLKVHLVLLTDLATLSATDRTPVYAQVKKQSQMKFFPNKR